MKKFLALILMTLLSASVLAPDAYAKRFGGGKSFGKQREQISQPAAPRPASPAPAAAPLGGRSWLGPIAGLVAGGLLASMFMGHGFDGIKLFDILLMAALAFGAFYLFRRMRQGRPQDQAPHPLNFAGLNPQPGILPTQAMGGAIPFSSPTDTRPAWFEDEPFLRAAKGHFIRLQEAYDRGDVNDIREYTTPEVFAEIQLQLQERGGALNKTEVLQLNAAMLNVVTENDLVIASVRFTGQLREEVGAPATELNEIWHIQKSATDQNAAWYVAGIQQAS
jgi:predicted lipid-binding transport protein (Tim44 family)